MPAPLAPANNKTNTSSSSVLKTGTQKQQPHVSQPKVQEELKTRNKEASSQRYPPTLSKQPQQQPSRAKKAYSRSSKPIINWFQRKWAGRPRTTSDTRHGNGKGRVGAARDASLKRIPSTPSLPTRNSTGTRYEYRDSMRPNTISLNGDDDFGDRRAVAEDSSDDEDEEENERSTQQSSMWSPSSPVEADEDASVRPLPPSAPPSPSPSRSSSSYLSDPRTFRSIAASTKPTTLLSIDLTNNGMAHIAQAPPTPLSQVPRVPPHRRASSTGAITFSVLPLTGGQPTSPAPYILNAVNIAPGISRNGTSSMSTQAPQHTTHHPRDNPRPSSPPQDNASVLTLASSAFGIPGARTGLSALVSSGRAGSTIGAAEDSVSRFEVGTGDSLSHFALGDDMGDLDASVRALRPRSSRRGSWESEASEWSAKVGGGPPSMMRDRSFRTSFSARTGVLFSGENESEVDDVINEDVGDRDREEKPSDTQSSAMDESSSDAATEEHLYAPLGESKGNESDHTTPSKETAGSLAPSQSQEPETTPKILERSVDRDYFTPGGGSSTVRPGHTAPQVEAEPFVSRDRDPTRLGVNDDNRSIAASENPNDVFYSAPGTPFTS